MLNRSSANWLVKIAIPMLSVAAGQAADLVSISAPSEGLNGVTVTLTNNSAQTVTGVLIRGRAFEGTRRRAEVYHYMDIYTNYGVDKAVPPGESRLVLVFPKRATQQFRYEVEFGGAIFSDGFTFGPSDGVGVLTGRRQHLRDSLQAHEAALRETKGSGRSLALARVNLMAGAIKETAKQRRREDASLFSVETLVNDWVTKSLGSEADDCDQNCVNGRFDHILKGIGLWRSHLATSLPQL